MTIGQAKEKPYWFALCLTDVFYFSSVRYSFICCALSGFYLYFVLSYTKILSRSTDSCAKGSKVPSDTKSTFLPKSSSKSLHMPKNFKPIGLLLSKETIISTSLSFVSSPLEKEPNSHYFSTGWVLK